MTARATFGVCGRRAPAVSAAIPSIAAAAQAGRSTTSAGSSGSPSPMPGDGADVPLGDGGVRPQPADELDGVVPAHGRAGGDEAGRGAPGEGPVDGQAGVELGLGCRRRARDRRSRRTRPTLRADGRPAGGTGPADSRTERDSPHGRATRRTRTRNSPGADAQLAVSGSRSG